MRDWTAAYRMPYYNHKRLIEWTGGAHDFAVPFERVLFAPTQVSKQVASSTTLALATLALATSAPLYFSTNKVANGK